MSEDLWLQYRETNDMSLRNRLVLTYVTLVETLESNDLSTGPEREAVRDEAKARFRGAFERLSPASARWPCSCTYRT
jgi:hypothetical protein